MLPGAYLQSMKSKVIIFSLLTATATGVVAGGLSRLQQSAVVKTGKALAMPYEQTFESPDDAAVMTLVDANGDGNTWTFFGDCMIYGVSDDRRAADDWLITPALWLSSDSIYEVTTGVHADDSWAEQLSIWAGADATATAMAQPVMATTTITQDDYITLTSYFRPTGTDPLHLGLHVTTPGEDGSYLYVNRISVKAIASVLSPAAATHFTVSVTHQGLTANLQFDAPATDNAGTALQTIDSIVVCRDDQHIVTLKDVQPGERRSLTDEPDENGYAHYTLTAYNAHGGGIPVSATVYIGDDTPLPVSEAMATESDQDGHISISWKAPGETGIHDGYVNIDELTYEVSGIGGNPNKRVTVKGTSLTDTVALKEGTQQLIAYVITPLNSTGRGESVTTNTVFVGNPYAIPYAESFPRKQQQQGPWSISNDEAAEWDIMQYGTYADAADHDGGLLAFFTTTEGRSATITGPKLSLKGIANPRLQMQVWYMNRAPHLLHVSVLTPDGALHELDSFSPVDTTLVLNVGKWKRHAYSLAAYSQYDYVQLVLQGVGGYTDDPSTIVPVYVDDIRFDDPIADDLAASTLYSMSDHVTVGDEVRLSFTIVNQGTNTAKGYKTLLYRDSLCVDTVSGPTVESNDSVKVTLADVVNADARETSRYRAVVAWENDANELNDTSASIAVTVLPGKPFLTQVAASETGQGVTIAWQQPEGIDKDVQPKEVTEDFESYDAFSINQMGQWTLVDGDRHNTIGIQDGTGNFVQYPNVEQPMAYMVFNPSKAQLNAAYFPTHSGRQVAATFSVGRYDRNDDWLISPAVDGAQTIRFWACSPDASYYGTQEQLQVLVSTADADTASFRPVGGTIAVSGQWREYTATLPEGARYFALRCTSLDQYILFIDDITFRKAARDFQLTAYNVYRDGTLLATCAPTDLTYTDNDGSKQHAYAVSAVYTIGESRQTKATWQESTGISQPTTAVTNTSAPAYNLAGQRVGKDYKGIIVVDGKKILRR